MLHLPHALFSTFKSWMYDTWQTNIQGLKLKLKNKIPCSLSHDYTLPLQIPYESNLKRLPCNLLCIDQGICYPYTPLRKKHRNWSRYKIMDLEFVLIL